jgi:hypothetical protein
MVVGAARQETKTREPWRDVLWLTGRDIRRDWLGYLTSAAYMLVLGSLLAPGFANDDVLWGPEIAFLAMVFIMTQPFFSRDYMSWENDRVAARLTFLRMLPIPVEVILRSRMLALVAAGIVNVPAFFIPLYLLGDWPFGVGPYIAFVLFWTGISLIGTGYGLSMEMAVSVRRYTLTNLVVILVVIAVLTVTGIAAELWLVTWSVERVAEHPVLMAVAGPLVGMVACVAFGRLATDRLRRRELTP